VKPPRVVVLVGQPFADIKPPSRPRLWSRYSLITLTWILGIFGAAMREAIVDILKDIFNRLL
jgi:hypothetical protein